MTFKELPISFDFVLGNERWRKVFTQFLQELKDPLADASILKLYLTVWSTIGNPSGCSTHIMKSLYNTYYTKNNIGYLSDELRVKFGETLERRVYNESIFTAVKQELRPLLENELFPKFVKSDLFKLKCREELQKCEQPVQDDAPPASVAPSKPAERQTVRASKRAMHNSFSNGQEVFIDEFVNPAAPEAVHHFAKPHANSLSYSALDASKGGSGGRPMAKSMKSPSTSSVASSTASQAAASGSRHASSKSSSRVKMASVGAKNSSCNKSIISLNENVLSEQLSKSSANAAASYSAKNQSMLNLNLSANSHAVPSRGASIGPISTHKATTSIKMPPNPYHVPTKAIPISAQDSEIQSMVSISDSNRPPHHSKPHVEDFGAIDGKHAKSSHHHHGGAGKKPVGTPLSQENPLEFFNQVSAKLMDCLNKAKSTNDLESGDIPLNPNPVQVSFDRIPLDVAAVSGQPTSTAEESALSLGLANMKLNESASSRIKDAALRLGANGVTSGSILDDHMSRVEKHMHESVGAGESGSSKSSSSKVNTSLSNQNQKQHYGMSLINNMLKKSSPKLINNSINSAKSRLGLMTRGGKDTKSGATNTTQQDCSSNLDLTLVSSNIDTSQASIRTSDFNQSATANYSMLHTASSKFNSSLSHHHQHHQSMSTNESKSSLYYGGGGGHYGGKEVDIDSHTTRYEQQQHQAMNMNNSLSKNHSMHNKTAHEMQHSLPSAKHDRVTDWLASGNYHAQSTSSSSYEKPADHSKKETAPAAFTKTTVDAKTTVAYYLPGEEVAYMTTFQGGQQLTLAKFKQLVTKKGQFRYFFKTKSDLLDEDGCVVFQEITDEATPVPMFNNKVIAKIEKV